LYTNNYEKDVPQEMPMAGLIKRVVWLGRHRTTAVEGVEIKVYTLAKTIADCFKYRHKIGLDMALEALRECRRERRCTMDDLWHYAKVCRVANVMRPYLEVLA
jgi:predicted transcriptional regulator of viral defense system